jgi:glycosyltransferase involved in cell wall biosynthesis
MGCAKVSISRLKGLYKDNVTSYIVPSEHTKKKLLDGSIRKAHISVLPHMVNTPEYKEYSAEDKYIAYSGRISQEKGVDSLLMAANRVSHIPFCLTGEFTSLNSPYPQPPNTSFVGWLSKFQMTDFYRNARFLVIPSSCFETFGLIAIEAMSCGLAVVASKRGALKEIVEDGVTGLLFEPGNVEELVSKIKMLWDNPELCRKMGMAGRENVIQNYNEVNYLKSLMSIYKGAMIKNQVLRSTK